MSVLLVLNAVIYDAVNENGIIVTLIIVALISHAVYLSRDSIVNIIKSIPKGERAIKREIKSFA